MSTKTTIGISKECLSELYDAKFDFRVNTLEETVRKLLNEHHQKQEVTH